MKRLFIAIITGVFTGLFYGCSDNKTQKKELNIAAKKDFLFAPSIAISADSIFEMPDFKPSDGLQTPPEMTFVAGGITLIGSEEGLGQEQPLFWVRVKPFLIDTHPVTVADFRKFVKATTYQTEAEKFGDGGVFEEETQAWTLKKGADWQYPQGHDQPPSPDNHPVTQVSWNDAAAYARWAGKRLPYEIEWEHAARNACNARTIYPFGNEIVDKNKKYRANIWQGHFPKKNYVEDGFRFTSPVGYFGKTPLGLTDMTGNVWQWCQDWKANYADWVAGNTTNIQQEKVQRGGSFLCEPGWCHGYRVSGRSFSTPESALMHVGFRCIKDW